jgi:hypothetical protein
MKLDNHIAKRFLTDPLLPMEMLSTNFPDIDQENYTDNNEVMSCASIIFPENGKVFYCTKTVLDKLDMLKTSRKDGVYDWSVFCNVSNGKSTYIFEDNSLLRVLIHNDMIHICHLRYVKRDDNFGELKWAMFYVDRITGVKCDHFDNAKVAGMEEFIYSLLCFIHLTENDEIEVKGKHKVGTKKQGKFVNVFPFTVTIINSRWNTTVHRTDGFGVRGHFAIRRIGEGRTGAKLVFIEPYEKQGYTRKARSINN